MKNILRRSCLAGRLTQTWGVKCFVQGLYILQTGMHAWHFEHIVAPRQEIQSLTAHTNPPVYEVWHRGSVVYVCARHRHRGVKSMDEMCDKNSIFACFDAMITQKSHDNPGYRSWFHFSFDHDVAHAFWRHLKQWRWQHVQPLRVNAIQNTKATIVVQSQQQAVKLMWRYKLILNDMLTLKFTSEGMI